MKSKGLIDISFETTGILYVATSIAKAFISYHQSEYAKKLYESVNYVTQKFRSFNDQELEVYINQNLEKWGGEFTREAFIRGAMNYD